jgi:hypothetical protein
MTDEKLIAITREVDQYLLNFASKHQVSALLMSSVFLARLILLNDTVGSGDEMRQLLVDISGAPLPKDDEVSLH